jgi:hypothetical protein
VTIRLLDFEKVPEVNGQTFHNQTVQIDGSSYRNCTFDGCTIIYSGGASRLDSCKISPNCSIEFRDAAAYVIQILRELEWTMLLLIGWGRHKLRLRSENNPIRHYFAFGRQSRVCASVGRRVYILFDDNSCRFV